MRRTGGQNMGMVLGRVPALIGACGALMQVVGHAVGAPHVTAGPGWSLIVLAVVGITHLGAAAAALITPRYRTTEDLYGHTGDPAPI